MCMSSHERIVNIILNKYCDLMPSASVYSDLSVNQPEFSDGLPNPKPNPKTRCQEYRPYIRLLWAARSRAVARISRWLPQCRKVGVVHMYEG